MPSPRVIEPLVVPAGRRAPEVLPALRKALDGDGPALLPVAEGSEPVRALGPGAALGPGEDTAGDPTALVIATSGSTGVPKGVLLPASALRASAEATHLRLGGPGHWLLPMPAHHIAGIQVLVRALLAGTTPVAVDTAGGFRPDRFADAAAETLANDGPHYTSMVPTQLSRLVNDGGQGLAALRRFDAVLLGGAATPPALLRRALDAGVRVVPTYGMSETAGGCVYDGVPLDGVRVHIDAGGVVSLAGPTLARGYRGVPGSPAFAGGWFRTGDLGRWAGDRLEILGRADDVIITGGVNVAPTPIERILTEHEGVREVCVLGVEDPEWGQAVVAAVVPSDPACPPSAEALRAAVRERAQPAAAPKNIVFLPELPLRGPGKPDRTALRQHFAG
ncbi:O-succinylbenzoic acid--CoA ligase [Saccharopolyspora erythraea NRRL 2338]|uniref:O-succinylbenzoic acid--CoA ligase n=2 Tax=Saccharopolyspora erythraea TaxID=1836 RepID=A4FPV4_SACEN|nr:o-succinylbenzoate--CoA ligase [Saccharopolyspora erythraea]PFG99724.1 O-succinylbenzoic acid--CoA ligase [Saccharopolyspora erythraea NRRL 2338]QRK89605.1 AMP-binding protein [Saccharopolyspora erythraea]CAM06079.1 O-succinylbenzoic acid--CoA ligase [Saccharopolyspora erythraea NRRL 2338]